MFKSLYKNYFLSEFFKPIPLSLHSKNKKAELVAQLVEQYTFNVWAQGSSPCQFTKRNPEMDSFFYYQISDILQAS